MYKSLKLSHVIILVVLCLVISLDNISETAVFIFIPKMTAYFQTTLFFSQWIVAGYMLTAGSLQLLFGEISSNYGYKKIFCSGLLILIVTSILCAISKSEIEIIIYRLLQGVGYAMTFPLVMAIARIMFPDRQLGLVMGIFGGVAALSLAVGPLIAVYFLEKYMWKDLFYLFSILFSIILILAISLIKNEGPIHHININYQFNFIFVLSMGLLLFLINSFYQPVLVGILPLFLVISSTFTWAFIIKRKLIRKIFRSALELFEMKFWIAVFSRFFLQIIIYSFFYVVSYVLQRVYMLSFTDIGVLMSIALISMAILSPIFGRLIDIYSAYPFIFFGIAGFFATSCMLYFININSGIYYLSIVMFSFGSSVSMLIPGLNVLTFTSTKKDMATVASAIYYTLVTLSGAFAVAITTLFMTQSLTNGRLMNSYNSGHAIVKLTFLEKEKMINSLSQLSIFWVLLIAFSLTLVFFCYLKKNKFSIC